MKDSEIYKKAARLVAERKTHYSCVAIDDASGADIEDWNRQTKRYQALFRNERSALRAYDAELAGGRKWRVLALCLMAAIAESEGR